MEKIQRRAEDFPGALAVSEGKQVLWVRKKSVKKKKEISCRETCGELDEQELNTSSVFRCSFICVGVENKIYLSLGTLQSDEAPHSPLERAITCQLKR